MTINLRICPNLYEKHCGQVATYNLLFPLILRKNTDRKKTTVHGDENKSVLTPLSFLFPIVFGIWEKGTDSGMANKLPSALDPLQVLVSTQV